MKFVYLFLAILCFFSCFLHSATITGGSAASASVADVILDIVFIIDASGSMSDEASGISSAMYNVVKNLSIPNGTVYVNSRMMGIQGTWANTYFNESTASLVAPSGYTKVTNSSEDNAPAINDLIMCYPWAGAGAYPGKNYYKAIVTIGDEGTQNGSPVNTADWTAAYSANQMAKQNNVMIFSLLGNSPTSGAAAVFQALAVGGTGGGYTLQNTGGTFTQTASSTLQQDIQNAISIAAQGGVLSANSPSFGNVRVGSSGNATLTVTNNPLAGGNSTGTIGPAAGSEFSPTSGSQSFTLAPGQNASRTYTYTPNARGTDSTTITINSDVSTITKTITGTGVSPVYSSSVAPGTKISFTPQFTNTNQTLTIQNTTPDAELGDLTKLTIKSATISGTNANYFSLSNFTPGTTLTKDALTNLTLTANSSLGGIGTKTATLTVVTDQNAALGATGSTFTYQLEIAAQAAGVTAGNVNFGNVRIGDSKTATLTVSNSGGWGSALSGTIGQVATTNFSSTTGDQSFSNLAVGQSTTRTYTFNPTAVGSTSTTVNVVTNGGNATPTLTGTGVSPVFSSSFAPGATIDLGEVGYTASQAISIQNVVATDLGDLTDMTVLSATITGPDASYFSLENFMPGMVLGKSDIISFLINFMHNYRGRDDYGYVRTATLTITTDVGASLGSAGQTYSFLLQATTIPEPSTWTAFGFVIFLFFFTKYFVIEKK